VELTPDRITLYDSPWKISHNASRSGYRLKGPRLEWARAHGGEGGAHPANVIDEPYSYGGLNWNGDEPVVLPIVRRAS
jgi:urea carboxylase